MRAFLGVVFARELAGDPLSWIPQLCCRVPPSVGGIFCANAGVPSVPAIEISELRNGPELVALCGADWDQTTKATNHSFMLRYNDEVSD